MKYVHFWAGHWSNLGFFRSLGHSHVNMRKQVSLYIKLYVSHLVIRSFCVFGQCWNDQKEISIGIEQHYGSHLVFLVIAWSFTFRIKYFTIPGRNKSIESFGNFGHFGILTSWQISFEIKNTIWSFGNFGHVGI